MKDILKVYAPFDHSLIDEIPRITENELEEKLASAYALFKDTSRHLPKYKRIEILERLAEIMSGKIEELTNIAAQEGGKPYIDSKIEV